MDNYDVFYWLGILGGNVCYIAMLFVLGGAMKRTGAKRVGYVLLTAVMLAGFIFINPFSKEIKLPGIVSGNYVVLGSGARVVIGSICTVMPYAVMRAYRFLAFDLQQYYNKNKDKSIFYVYHTFFVLFHLGLWCVWMVSALFFASAVGEHFKSSWEGIFGALLVIYYMGGICMAVLRQKTFEVEKGHFKYNGLRKICEGTLEDIESVEKTGKGIILHVKGEKLVIGCHLEELADLFGDKMINSEIGN